MKAVVLCLLAVSLAGAASVQEGAIPKGIPSLDHVFIIMMENHAYAQVIGNPNEPFVNSYAKSVNYATNYFAVGHPSLTNYLEIVGGSNFGVRDDNSPDWNNGTCTPNIMGNGTVSLESNTNPICPIYGSGTDAAAPVIDFLTKQPGLRGLSTWTAKWVLPPIQNRWHDDRRPARRLGPQLEKLSRRVCRPPAPRASTMPMASIRILTISLRLFPARSRRKAISSIFTP